MLIPTQPAAVAEFMTRLGLHGLRSQSYLLDAIFYDVALLTIGEQTALGMTLSSLDEQMLTVPPEGPISVQTMAEWERHEMAVPPGEGTRHIALAGLGSSALGAAAFARAIARAIQAPVLAPISGNLLTRLSAETLAGWTMFGQVEGMYAWLTAGRRFFDSMLPPAWRLGTGTPSAPVPGQPWEQPDKAETAVLSRMTAVLDARGRGVTLYGHSRGSLLIRAALLARPHPTMKLEAVHGFGVVLEWPDVLPVRQYLGTFDGFGHLNSRLHLPHKRLPLTGHHCNSLIEGAIPVTRLLRD